MSGTLAIGAVAAVTFLAMEAIARAAHRYLMHGPLWFIHKTHHQPRRGWFELNDIFGLAFTALSVALMFDGPAAQPYLFAVGAGMAAYGVAYFLVHDILVHRRVRHLFVPRRGYLHRVYQAHRLHHAARRRDGAVAFGFIIPPGPERLAAQRRRLRATKAVRPRPVVTAAPAAPRPGVSGAQYGDSQVVYRPPLN